LQEREVDKSSDLSQSICHLQLTRTKERVEQEEKREGRWSASSNTHAMAKDRASERSDTQENTNAQSTHRVPRPTCTKWHQGIPRILAVLLSPREPKECYGLKSVQAYKGLEHEGAQRGRERDKGFTFL
jgi:hypothetical protein